MKSSSGKNSGIGSNLSLADLVEVSSDTFTDDAPGGDGTVYPVRMRGQLSSTEKAQYDRYAQIMAQARKRYLKRPNDRASVAAVERGVDGVLRILIPDFPKARLAEIPSGAKDMIIEWWARLPANRIVQDNDLVVAEEEPAEGE